MASFVDRVVRGFKAFRKEYLSTGLTEGTDITFADFEARRLRYDIFWRFYENTAYDSINKWMQKYMSDYGLYEYTRPVYNPTSRLGDFWHTHLMGGYLDPEAGDGLIIPNALPILIPDENKDGDEDLRAAIAQVWNWSRWQAKKDIVGLLGTILGDMALYIVDDPVSKAVYIDLMHPGLIKDVDMDRRGNIKAYEIVETRIDPEDDRQKRQVQYTETATREGDNVVFRTYRDASPYHWDGNPGEEWSEAYGFIPLLLIQHKDVGMEWGWSELHSGRVKFMEMDDLSSKAHDQIRKSVDPPWFFSGVTRSSTSLEKSKTTPTSDRPQPGREEINAIFAHHPQAKAQALVSDLDMNAVVAEIKNMLEELERDYPELQYDIDRAIQTNSGRALRLARQRSEVKVIQRRPNYDDGVMRAIQMCISIAAYREYEGFTDWDLDSYQRGALDFRIGNRTVYRMDPIDEAEIEEAFWTNAGLAVEAGVPLLYYLESKGWHEDELSELEAALKIEEQKQKDEADRQAQMGGNNRPKSEPALDEER